jgi:hypothetical protein
MRLRVIMWAFAWAAAYGARSGRPRAWEEPSWEDLNSNQAEAAGVYNEFGQLLNHLGGIPHGSTSTWVAITAPAAAAAVMTRA